MLAGDRRAVARAISMVEDGGNDLPRCRPGIFRNRSRVHRGADRLARRREVEPGRRAGRRRARAGRDGGRAGDRPHSPYTGGALLGDRVRMQDHATDPGVFIRSMATRGHLGGMALAAPEAIRILDASGKDLVIVETVGVGQAEVEVAGATDTTLVVVAPGWGDAVQAAKAGILEMADVFAVNKADRDGVDDAVRDLNLMLRTGEHGDWSRRWSGPRPSRRGCGRAAGGDRDAPRPPGAAAGSRRAGARRVLAEVEDMVAADSVPARGRPALRRPCGGPGGRPCGGPHRPVPGGGGGPPSLAEHGRER